MGRARNRLVADGGAEICSDCRVADRVLPRLKGLLGRRGLAPGEGLLIVPAGSIHTLFMRFPIDVVFLDRELCVLRIVPALRPWRLTAARGARSALELAAGEAASRGLRPGVRLTLEPRDAAA